MVHEEHIDSNVLIPGSGSSDDTTSEEKKERNIERNESTSKRSVYTPAYRRQIQSKMYSVPKPFDDAAKSASTSITSVDMPKRQNSQVNVFDQMIPILPDNNFESTGNYSDEHESLQTGKRNASNETLIKSINGLDMGAYPKRGSSIQLSNNLLSSRNSLSSLHTHISSPSSNSKPIENVFDTPKSEKIFNNFEHDQELTEPEQYQLQNNYDIKNSAHIAEEDQYENEFTNYSENKREFIDSLRPKIQ